MDKDKKSIELQKEVVQLINNHLETKGISKNKLAKMIGVSPATISNIHTQQWDKINDVMLLKIRSYFKGSKSWTIVKTSNFSAIQSQCDKARLDKMMIGIIGYSGSGKTTGLSHYFKQNANTYMVTCARAMRTKQFLAEILKALGVDYMASDYMMTRRIITELNTKEAPLLIIDEASKLSQNALMYIQDIWDGVENNSGIVLSGVDYLLSNIEKWSNKGNIGMPEFFSRVYSWVNLKKPTKKEIQSICNNNGLIDIDSIKQVCYSSNFRQVRNVILSKQQ